VIGFVCFCYRVVALDPLFGFFFLCSFGEGRRVFVFCVDGFFFAGVILVSLFFVVEFFFCSLWFFFPLFFWF